MKRNSIFLRIALITALVLISGCGGGGGGGGGGAAGGLVVEAITGPDSVNENTDAQYSVTASGDTNITYAWACEPASTGTWTNQQSATATFHAGFVTTNTQVTIRVTVNSDKGQSIIRDRIITVKDTGAVGPTVGDITGSLTVNENSSAQYSVSVTGGTGVTYAWSCEPASAGTWTNQATSTGTFNASSVSADMSVTVKVAVNSNELSAPIVRELGITVKNVSNNQPPIAKAKASPNPQTVGLAVHFSDDGSYDPDGGSIVKFEWDFTNDGSADAEGSAVDHIYNTPGTYHVQMRVTDDEGQTDMLDVPIEINIKSYPVAVAEADPNPQKIGEQVHFSGSGSYDPDGGLITKYEWDFNNDGGADAEGESVDHIYDNPGTYYVQMRVIDDEGATDMLDQPLEIIIWDNGWAKTWELNPNPYSRLVRSDWYGNLFYNVKELHYGVGFDPFYYQYCSEGYTDNTIFEWENYAIDYWSSDALFLYDGPPYPGEADSDFEGLIGLYDLTWDNSGNLYILIYAYGYSDNLYIYNAYYDFVQSLDIDGYDIDIDSTGNIYTAYDNSIIKYDSSGNKLWEFDCEADNVAVDLSGNIYVTYWDGLTDECSLYKYNSSGNLLWAVSFGTNCSSSDIDTDKDGNVYVTGSFINTVDFNPGPGVDNHTSNGGVDAFTCKFDSSGTFLWAKTWGGTDDDRGYNITVSPSDYPFTAGRFSGTVDFDPGIGVDYQTGDTFIIKFLPDGSW